MDERNKRILDHLGVTAWHDAGYTGKHGRTATAETENGMHGMESAGVFRAIAPDRTLVHVPLTIDGLRSIKNYPAMIDTMYASLRDTGTDTGEVDAALKDVSEHLTLFVAAGNDGKPNRIIEAEYVYAVGAYTLMVDGRMNPTNYTNPSQYVDFAAPVNINGFRGTSASTPALCGMAALVNDMAIQRHGRPLSSKGMCQFLKDNSIDIWDKGRDDFTGWGAPVLPPPETVDLTKYMEVEQVEFKDEHLIGDWAKEAVAEVVRRGIMTGKADGFDPKGTLTREEAAVIIARLLALKG
jgi:hypothetical protein